MSGPSNWPSEFKLLDQRSNDLLEAFRGAYPNKSRIREFISLTRIRESDVNFDGNVRTVWLDVLGTAAGAALIEDLLRTALADPLSAGHHDQFRALLTGDDPGPGPTPVDSLARAATQQLARAGASRSPIVIALELDGQALAEDELTRAACHLVVKMSPAQAATIEEMAAGVLDDAGSIDEIVEAGARVWARLTEAEQRLRALPERIARAGLTQPIAWCGRPDLLDRMRAPLQIAHTGGDGPRGFLSVGSGHYLMPVYRARDGRPARTMRPRDMDKDPAVGEVDLRGPGEHADWLSQLVTADIAIVVHPAEREVLAELGRAVQDAAGPPTRAVIAFGSPADAKRIDALLNVVPFVCCADSALAEPELRAALHSALAERAETSALPCVVAAVQEAWVGRAIERGDVAACRLGLRLSSWSWIGLPLFSRSFGALEPAEHPHLMVLRTIATRGWYYDRRERIDEAYHARKLADAPAGARFHLYLSGAGGTGKSCFLRHVHDTIGDRENSVAVWYRVDSPSSSWENVESRVREETVKAVGEKMDRRAVDAIRELGGDLGKFLCDAVTELREHDDFDEIAVFIDQLERTFESGDQPNFHLLGEISRSLVDLLKTVGTDKGVRVFIASRKQYLPDFLGSFRAAAASGLEFNVLQTISDESERVLFVQQVMKWCAKPEQKLVAPGVTMRDGAAKTLAGKVDGHPLNTMLALIQLLSDNVTGTITEEQVEQAEPWNKLFLLDLKAAERDDLDWFFLLAMAHARAEIVRFEEVWWRIRMVHAELTRQVVDLRTDGVKERLWLLGILGRTVQARPDGDDPMGFVEFFHANLRDYLLREVMGQGRAGVGIGGGRGGTPATWRALDRLSVFARDWAQIPQLLAADEIRVLMEHRDAVIEARSAGEVDPKPFHLLFLRDRPDARNQLSLAAQECFALSALVHDEAGTWAVEKLFPDVEDRAHRCGDWLRRCPEHRSPVLRYLVPLEAPAARTLLVTALLGLEDKHREQLTRSRHEPDSAARRHTEVLLGLDRQNREELQLAVAAVLTEPLYAARWRKEALLAALREALRRNGGQPARLPAHVPAFVVAACGRDREVLTGVIRHCIDRLATSDDANDQAMAGNLDAFRDDLDGWLGESPDTPLRRGISVADRGFGGSAPLTLLIGDHLRPEITDERLARWSETLRKAIGVPLPDLVLLDGEAEPDEIELQSYGQRIARGVFCPSRLRVSKRRWGPSGGAVPAGAIADLDRGEEVLWLPKEVVAARDEPIPTLEFEPALTGWLEEHCRRAFDLIFDVELEIDFLRTVLATETNRRRLARIGRRLLRTVVVSLIEEGVPFGERREAILQELADLAQRSTEPGPGPLTQKVREFVKDSLYQAVAPTGEVTTILLAEPLEEELANIVDDAAGRFERIPPQAMRLDAAIQTTLIRLAEVAGPPAVLITIPRLRQALSRLLRGLDYRLPVLSFTELPADLMSVTGGLVDVAAEPPNATAMSP